MIIRKYENRDAEEIAHILSKNFREVNIKDETKEELVDFIKKWAIVIKIM